MSTRNYDASVITKRARDKALGAFATAIDAAVNKEGGVATVRTTQPTYQSGEVVTQENLGVCACVTDRADNPYPFSCGCKN